MNSLIKKNLKIIKVPGFQDFRKDHFNELLLSPLGIAVISRHLREKGYDIEQDDLNAKIKKEQFHENSSLYKLNLLKQFDLNNKDEVFDYCSGNSKEKIDDIMIKLFAKIDICNVDILLLSCFQTDPISSLLALCMAYYAKKKNKNIIVIVGGEHQAQQLGPGRNTFIKENIKLVFELGVIDYYIRGAGEESLEKLIVCFDKGLNLSNNIDGLIYRNLDGQIISNEPAMPEIRVPDFNGLPLGEYIWRPNKILLKMAGDIEGPANDRILILPFQFMVGCPNKCIFCEASNPRLRLKIQDPEITVKTLRFLSEAYKTKYFFFLNSCINISKKYINEFCDRIIDSKLEIMWTDSARVDNLDKETLLKMRKAGAVRLVFGLETGSEKMLRYLDKHINLYDVENVLHWCYEANIWCCLESIAGLPFETDKDIELTIEFFRRNYKYIDTVFSNTFYLEPNSAMAYFPERYGLENIRKMSESSISFVSPTFTLAFDEINGLRWEEKFKQQRNSYSKINKVLRGLDIYHPDSIDETHTLFYLYSKYSDKQNIKRIYRKFYYKLNQKRINKMILYALKNPSLVTSRLLKAGSLKEVSRLFQEVQG